MAIRKKSEPLATLIAEFERSGIGRLALKGPTFELLLRAGKPPRWADHDPAQSRVTK